MLQSFYTAFTGLNAEKNWLSVISDNIANVNTVGFKAERAVFEDLLASSLTTYSNGSPINREIGGGVFVGATVKDFSQGTFMNTNNPLDMALDGEGFFMVKSNDGVTYYTRNGEFRLDANGDLINMLGMKVQGWMLDNVGNMSGSIGSINVPMSMQPAKTTYVKMKEPSNLDSRAPVLSAAAFNPNDSTTYNYVNSVTVYDSLGNPHTLDLYFVHTDAATNSWDVHVYADGDTTTEVGSTTLTFDSDGNLTGGSPTTVSVALTNGAASPMNINLDFSGMRQVASDFIFYAEQDGNSKGDLMAVSVSEDGIIKASYTNGKVKDIARLAIATFKDKEILTRKGSWLYLPNQQTFTPVIMPGGVISKVRSGMLEMSNVDIASEFINLITAQRAYQANARVITTDDQILQETMNIKR
ncbi:flagellar hook protein FlgE [Desulfurobacterium sp.]